jgi:hypothetical protein
MRTLKKEPTVNYPMSFDVPRSNSPLLQKSILLFPPNSAPFPPPCWLNAEAIAVVEFCEVTSGDTPGKEILRWNGTHRTKDKGTKKKGGGEKKGKRGEGEAESTKQGWKTDI